jgi:hypothetical protein
MVRSGSYQHIQQYSFVGAQLGTFGHFIKTGHSWKINVKL